MVPDQTRPSLSDSSVIRNYPKLLHRYARLLEATSDLSSTLELDTLLQRIVAAASELTESEVASLLLYDASSNHLYFETATNQVDDSTAPTAIPIEGSIAGWIFSHNKPLLIEDASKDERVFREMDLATRFQTRNMVGVPLRTKEKTLGVIEAINKKKGTFDQQDVNILQALAAQAAIAIENSRLFQQSDLIAELVHELRTPLTALTAASHIMDRGNIPEEQRQKLTRTLINEVQRLNNMATDFLDLAQLESGRVRYQREPVHMEGLILECIEIIRPLANEKKISIETNMQHAGTTLRGDRNRLKQVFLNLLTNAVKYNSIAGKIVISVTSDATGTTVSVADTGIGIQEQNLPQLFQRFYRVPSTADGITGTGLGLVITKRIVEGHKGNITVTSQPGQGSTFSVTIPHALP